MKKIILGSIVVLGMLGCASSTPAPTKQVESNVTKVVKKVKEVLDPCEVSYQQCSLECKTATLNEEDWKKTACEAKCKTLYGACKTKEGAIKGYKYTKEKTIQGYKYIQQQISK